MVNNDLRMNNHWMNSTDGLSSIIYLTKGADMHALTQTHTLSLNCAKGNLPIKAPPER